ncbi:MAG: lipocalin-like domain-containing protein [Alphaproteobacteria bacterium]|nr:lipocalin-like domain-containing protein [Alphaproteobacteria bacterium]
MDALIGAWSFVGMDAVTPRGIVRPFGSEVQGRLLYLADGRVSVHAASAVRPRVGSGDPFRATDGEAAALARGYVGYTGRWWVEGDLVHHRVETSFFPNWEGEVHPRRIQLDGDELVLSTVPQAVGGEVATVHVRWRRE